MRLLALTTLVFLQASAVSAGSFALAAHCPPSFDEAEDGRCRLASLYQLYSAAPGQGGLRVPLPEMKGSFSPQQIDLGRLLSSRWSRWRESTAMPARSTPSIQPIPKSPT